MQTCPDLDWSENLGFFRVTAPMVKMAAQQAISASLSADVTRAPSDPGRPPAENTRPPDRAGRRVAEA
jgi:hypothetical protein